MLRVRTTFTRLSRVHTVGRSPSRGAAPRTMSALGGEAVVSVTEVHATRWLRLNSIKYVNAARKEQMWDACERTTRNPDASADAVMVFAVLRSAGAPPHTLLVKQFRPPMGNYALELPAGLIDPGETPAQAALRELKEETGFVATVRSVSPAACMSPGLTNETAHLVHVDIDLDAAENAAPAQAAEDLGNIEVLRVPLSGLRAALQAHSDAGGFAFSGLWTLAAGLAVAGGV